MRSESHGIAKCPECGTEWDQYWYGTGPAHIDLECPRASCGHEFTDLIGEVSDE